MSQALYRGRRVLWTPLEVAWARPQPGTSFCCDAMSTALDFDCDQHADPFACADGLMVYNPVLDEYGLPVHDGGASYVLVTHCPWCGVRLPESQRDRWFDETEALTDAGTEIPERFLSAAWRRPSRPGR